MRGTLLPPLMGAFLLSSLCCASFPQDPELDSMLQFEKGVEGGIPHGWGGGPPETLHFDTLVVHRGAGAARLERDAGSPNTFSTITKSLPIDFRGDEIVLKGYLRTEDVAGFSGLWLREEGPGGSLQFDNMRNRGIRGTTNWAEYAIRLPLNPNARSLVFGVLMVGQGKTWADDLELLVDGRPIALAPERTIPSTVLESDREFDTGSGITVSSLSENQVENVAVLGMVWGFLKYHHPRVASGELHWDYELFRVLPSILDAPNREARNPILSEWVDRLGVPEDCAPCAQAPADPHLTAPLEWIQDTELLGTTLSSRLQEVYRNRFSGPEQFYVSQVPHVQNPVFDRELPYASLRPPDAGFRILALVRLWNIVEYWFPYRNQLDESWPSVLREFLPRFVGASTWDSYRLELLALITRMQDTHANLWAALDVRPPRGTCTWQVAVRQVEGQMTISAFTNEKVGPASGLQIGDVIEAVDGEPVERLLTAWSPYYSASNETTRLRDMAYFLGRGPCGEGALTIRRRGESKTISVMRRAGDFRPVPHDRPGDTFQLLSPSVAYLKLSSFRIKDVDEYIQRASGTQGLVIDIRNYPSEFAVFSLGSRLIEKPTAFTRFTRGNLDNPGTFSWTPPMFLPTQSPGYRGNVVVLVDEVTISQAEYTAMALRAGPRAVVIGSTTAGADGNVSKIPLPGGLQTLMSGIGVFYPDKTPTQRVGIVPDIVTVPTIEGIREGRDEVLEQAIRHILGPKADESTVREMARPPAPESEAIG